MKGPFAICPLGNFSTAIPLRVTVRTVLATMALVWLAALPVAGQAKAPATAPSGTPPRVLVAVFLHSPDFQMTTSGMFRGQKEVIPLVDYDFGAALVDEVVAQLASDKRATFRAATAEEIRLLIPQLGSKQPSGWPDAVAAERIMVISVADFGGFYRPGLPRKLNVTAGVVLYDRPSGESCGTRGTTNSWGCPPRSRWHSATRRRASRKD